MLPTAGDVHVNGVLTQFSQAWLQDQNEFVAGKIFPSIPVRKKSDLYMSIPKGQWFRTDAKPRAPSTESAGSEFTVDFTNSYSCITQSAHKDIDDEIRANSDDVFDHDSVSTTFVMRSLLLRRELDFMAKFFKASLWTGSTTGADIVPAIKWDAANATPIKDLQTQIYGLRTKTGYRGNRLLLGSDVWLALQNSADFIDRIAVTQRRQVTTELLASLLELESVDIAYASQNTALEPATAVMANIALAKSAMLVYAPAGPSIMIPSAGYTFAWTGAYGATPQGSRMKRIRIDVRNSDRIEGDMSYDMKVVAADMGVFFTPCLT